jgi:zinc protease
MKKLTFSIIMLALATSTWAQTLDRSVRPKPGPAPVIKLGKTESFTLPNGLKVYVVEKHRLPTISIDIQFDVKPPLEGDQAGYRDMMSELLLTGTTTRTKDQLNEQIDFIGATIHATSEEIAAHGLTKYEDKIFDLMSDVVMNANMQQEELDKLKKRTQSELETQENEPDAMLENVTAALNYGPGHPYGEVNTPKTVENIKLESCRNYYKTFFRPNVAYMAIVGDVTVDQVKPLVEKYFGKWQSADVPVTAYTHYDPPAGTRVAVAPRVAAVQSVMNVTYPLDLKPGTEDVIKARVANTVLGGGSQGRLFLDLREKHGWTYGAYSTIKDDERIGNFTAYAKCRNAVTDSCVGAILDEMKLLQTEKVSDETLQNSISYMTGSFAIGLEDPSRVAQYAINIERYHMPKDYYENYLKNLSQVTADDVQQVAVKYIKPERANIIVVGSKDEVGAKLAKYAANNTVEYYDNYGATMKAEEKKAIPAGITADVIMKNYIAAIGGEKAIKAIKDIKTISTGEIQGMALTITEMKKAPGKYKETVEVNMQGKSMTMQKQVFDGAKGYQEQQGQKADMTADDVEEIKQEADIYADLHPATYHITRIVKGIENVKGSDAYVVEATDAKSRKITEYYDVKSGLLVRRIQVQDGPQGPASATSDYDDYRAVPGAGGYKIPYTVSENNLTAKVQTAEINKSIPDTEFK